MKTAVVIPTCKRPLMVEQLLDSLAQCAFPPSLDIYVVENGVRKMCARQAQLATECDTYILQVPERHRP